MLDHSCIRYQDLSQNRALFISDIHGEGELLKELLRKVHYVPGQDSLFLLGDLIEKGRASLDTLHQVMALSRQKRVVVLKGNNDEAEQLLEETIPLPMKLGYLRTRQSLISEMAQAQGITIDEKTDFGILRQRLTAAYAEEFAFLRDLPLLAAGQGYAAVHSSIQNIENLRQNHPRLMLKDNDFLLNSDCRFSVPVIVGHMPTVALRSLAQHPQWLSQPHSEIILTPHVGEFSALCGRSIEEIQADRIRCAEEYAVSHSVTLVLKGADTLIVSPQGLRCVNKTGNPSLAKAGSGDLLTGMIAALAARGLTPMDATCCGVWLHGKAADKAIEKNALYTIHHREILAGLDAFLMDHQKELWR